MGWGGVVWIRGWFFSIPQEALSLIYVKKKSGLELLQFSQVPIYKSHAKVGAVVSRLGHQPCGMSGCCVTSFPGKQLTNVNSRQGTDDKPKEQ